MEDNQLQFILRPKILSLDEVSNLGGIFEIASLVDADVRKIYSALYSFFEEPSLQFSRVKTYYIPYWEWYVRATWQLLLSLPEDRVLLHCASQMPAAFRCGVRVEDSLLFYIYRRCTDEKDMVRFFREMRRTIMVSTFPLNPTNQKSKTVAEVVDMYSKLDRKRDTLELSNFYASVQQELFSSIRSDDLVGRAELTKAFLDLLLFIRETNNIADVVLEYVEKKERELDIDFSKESAVAVKSDTEKIVKEKVEPTQVESHSYARIRSMIDARFPKDDAGQYVNIDGVLALLTSLAADYNDPHIAELYVYDEKQNMFMWSEDAV